MKRKGCHEVKAYSKHWPCLFPQLGAAGRVLRGRFHSDGWRGQNVAVKRVGDTVLRYRYPRYEFCSRSDDIRSICTGALDRLAIDWRRNGPFRISVARGRRSRRSMSTWAPKH